MLQLQEETKPPGVVAIVPSIMIGHWGPARPILYLSPFSPLTHARGRRSSVGSSLFDCEFRNPSWEGRWVRRDIERTACRGIYCVRGSSTSRSRSRPRALSRVGEGDFSSGFSPRREKFCCSGQCRQALSVSRWLYEGMWEYMISCGSGKGVDGDGWLGGTETQDKGRISRDGGEAGTRNSLGNPPPPVSRSARRPRGFYVTQGDPIPGERQRRFRMLVLWFTSFNSVLASAACKFVWVRDTGDTPC
ncbi:hypothetical protein BDP81DRAFT_80549 [Colletotrichum phormii]|uniref:Uncharacterized protein n=1 Tax=Colletotrichum phormii TaxID=359342 RepID=A0AAJ0A0N5_9PEZI|nr:uncharacterized protein BDP81DRAFT_80549 [Colletotrichum phormii]KAK1654279.1 hypothetical protein BDP81DRAFT_80549 [Colletotrichum phormii]